MRADMMRVQVAFALFRFPWIALPASFFIQPLFFIAHLMSPYFSWCIPISHVYHLSLKFNIWILFAILFYYLKIFIFATYEFVSSGCFLFVRIAYFYVNYIR